jgi:hypothetical protein
MYGSRDEAAAEEDRAILAETPVHNIAGTTPRKPKCKTPGSPRKPAHARLVPGAPMPLFQLDPAFQAMVRAFAEEYGTSTEGAMGQLVLGGMVNAYRRKNATLDDIDEECAAMTAVCEAFPSPARR